MFRTGSEIVEPGLRYLDTVSDSGVKQGVEFGVRPGVEFCTGCGTGRKIVRPGVD